MASWPYPNPVHASAMLQIPTVPGATQAILTFTDALDRVLRTEVVPFPPLACAMS